MAIQHISQLRCVICGTPRNWRKTVHALRESKGEIVAASDDEIMDAMNQTARMGAAWGT